MKAKEIQDLIDFIAKTGLQEVNVETESFKISVKRSNQPVMETVVSQLPSTTPAQPVQKNVEETIQQQTEAKVITQPKKEENYHTIKSPMIGTFYRSPHPDSPSFINIGDEIKVGSIVCIIEAMKLFNEIESEVAGKIVKVLVENASPVEYDQPLFLVEAS